MHSGFDIVTCDSCNNAMSTEHASLSESATTAQQLPQQAPTVAVSSEELDDGVVPDNDDSTASGDDDDSPTCASQPQRERINERGVRFIPESEKVTS
ncbi:hypothetical protein Tcan_02082 [Toxocara canis]|uniref:Uncharacterized protein n=1 Tax=Toxocara canis TaxID=6265 RepID=A0A0B2UL72_TOXCA|nr:hypothetical protein Tcan_02082 [Toxocara canis]